MPKKLTHEEFCERISLIYPNIEILGNYVNANTAILCRCKIDNCEWSPKAGSLLGKEGCPKCGGTYRYSKEEFLEKLFAINPNIILLSDYFTTKVKVKVKCLLDGYEWNTTPSSLLMGYGCHRCGNVERYTTDIFKKKMYEINPDIEVLGEYAGHYGKIKLHCLIDDNIWYATPHTLFEYSGCPCCSCSKGEKITQKFLIESNLGYSTQYRFKELLGRYGQPLKFDFAVFKESQLFCLIEIDGIGHRKPIKFRGMSEEDSIYKFELIKEHDDIKDRYCKEHDINLIRIYYTGKNFNEVKKILEKELNPLLEGR